MGVESGHDPMVCGQLGEVMPWLGVGYVDVTLVASWV